VKKLLLQKKQFVLYCIIGLSGTLVDFSVFSLLIRARLLDVQAANAISYSCGTMLSFILNARFNFRITDRIMARLVCFFGVAFLGWLTSAFLLHVLVDHYHFDKYLSKLATLVVVVLLQYNLNRLLSFRKLS
jgi:putative flippase GtrA